MPRTLAIALAALATTCAFSAPLQARPDISFDIRPDREGSVRIRIERDQGPRDQGNWSTNVPIGELRGYSAGAIERGGPINFSYVRPAGRFDCGGVAHDSHADGSCSFAANEAFGKALAARGIDYPDEREFYDLAMSGIDVDLVDALKAKGFGTPTARELVGLGIFKVTPDFVREMAGIQGMRVTTGDLVSFKIFKVTPDMVREFAALGYRDLAARDLVQFKIHGISAAYVKELGELGYRNLPVPTLVQMRIFGVTPAYIRSFKKDGEKMPTAEELVRTRIMGRVPFFRWGQDGGPSRNWSWR